MNKFREVKMERFVQDWGGTGRGGGELVCAKTRGLL